MASWTPAQLEAIYKEGTNIIVSAGAGSGKTAVLTERVIQKLKRGININQLLILTFTKAAANEMKDRIRSAIKKDSSLHHQEELVDASYITTFDSFSLSIVKKYHYLLNLKPNVQIGDDNIIKIARINILEEIFDELYQNPDEDFSSLISDFCLKDDDIIKASILSIYSKLQMKFDRKDYLSNYFFTHLTDEKINEDIKEYESLILNKIHNLESDFNNRSSLFSDANYETLSGYLQNLFSCTSYDDVRAVLINFKLPNLKKGESEEAKKYKAEIKDITDEIATFCNYRNLEEIKETIKLTNRYAKSIVSILQKLDERLTTYKSKNELFDFTDIAFMAIKIVKENAQVRNELKATYNEILLDEYQDTNDLQELFINLIANNNVYMVGDVKQSIYRFRNANPSLFMSKYLNYSKQIDGYKIDLNKNFRSRREVIKNINDIFTYIMDQNIGGAEYKKEHMMEFGNTLYEENKGRQNYNYEFLTYQKDEKFTNREIEAFIIAKDIKQKVESKYQVFDKDLKALRDMRYSDATILIDRSRDFTLFKKVFDYFNIPLEMNKDDNITDSTLVLIIKNLLQLIVKYKNAEKLYLDNEFKHAFASVARSFIFEFDDDTILNLINTYNYYKNEIYTTLKPLIYEYEKMNIKEVLLQLYSLTGIEMKLTRIGNVKYNSIILEYLTKIAESLSVLGYNVEDYVKYINLVYDNDLQIVANINKSSNNSCKIMTIHKSKGLEFPVCYFSMLNVNFNKSEVKERFVFDDNYGIITPYFKEGIGSTIYKELIKQRYNQEDISEKIRLFYVALTRCKEKMIFVVNDEETPLPPTRVHVISNYHRLKYSSLNDIIASVMHFLPDKQITMINNSDLGLTDAYNEIKDKNYKQHISIINEKLTPVKIDIDSKVINATSFSKKITKIIDKKEALLLETGTYMHHILESIDLKNPQLENLDISFFYKEKIQKFLALPLLANIKDANVYQEYEFSYFEDDMQKTGIIDLMIEDENSIKIVDYKLKNLDSKEYLDQLKGYQKYISSLSSKRIETYLYSIFDETLVAITQ
jgi:ATP-dependent helicase/nuclease subunit A